MNGKIALEEHFAIAETLQDSAGFVPGDYWKELSARILDIHDRRLREMDAHGIEMMLLSLNAPAVQAIPDIRKASEMARRANDYLAAEVVKRPDRFQGFASLPMQDPEQAARELTRCITELGFKGALVNGFSQAGDGSEVQRTRPSEDRPPQLGAVVRSESKAVATIGPAESGASLTTRAFSE